MRERERAKGGVDALKGNSYSDDNTHTNTTTHRCVECVHVSPTWLYINYAERDAPCDRCQSADHIIHEVMLRADAYESGFSNVVCLSRRFLGCVVGVPCPGHSIGQYSNANPIDDRPQRHTNMRYVLMGCAVAL